jgi:hypothetical protein
MNERKCTEVRERKRERENAQRERERTLQKRPNENGKLGFNIRTMRCNVSRWILSLNQRKMNVFHSVWHLFSYFYYYFTFFILTLFTIFH